MAVQFIPTLMTGEKKIDEAFSIACGDFAGNVLFYKNGLLKEPVPVIAAGRMYRTPWTRDAAFNTWYAGALLCPSAAKNALLSVLSDKSGKLLIDEEFGQYWESSSGSGAHGTTGSAPATPNSSAPLSKRPKTLSA